MSWPLLLVGAAAHLLLLLAQEGEDSHMKE